MRTSLRCWADQSLLALVSTPALNKKDSLKRLLFSCLTLRYVPRRQEGCTQIHPEPFDENVPVNIFLLSLCLSLRPLSFVWYTKFDYLDQSAATLGRSSLDFTSLGACDFGSTNKKYFPGTF